MVMSESLLVVGACTLAGGVGPRPAPPSEVCRSGTTIMDCTGLDRQVQPDNISLVWGVTLATIVVLGVPTILARSQHKEQGMRCLAGFLFQALWLLAACVMTDHPALNYALSLHACVRLLARLEVQRCLVGGGRWWGLRFATVLGILAYAALHGPPVSVVGWPEQGADTRTCAYIAHLAGCILPGLVLDVLGCLISAARYVDLQAGSGQ